MTFYPGDRIERCCCCCNQN